MDTSVTSIDTTRFPHLSGNVSWMTAGADDNRPFLVFVPSAVHENSPMMVAIHGIKEDVNQIANAFIPYAERHGIILIAPLFSRKIYFDYMRLVCSRPRADL